MGYRELVNMMQQRSGFNETEAEESLDLLVESLAERLSEPEREDFAILLPEELRGAALSADVPSMEEQQSDLVQEFMAKESVSEEHAEQQVRSAWDTLKSYLTDGAINRLMAQLPAPVVATLH